MLELLHCNAQIALPRTPKSLYIQRLKCSTRMITRTAKADNRHAHFAFCKNGWFLAVIFL